RLLAGKLLVTIVQYGPSVSHKELAAGAAPDMDGAEPGVA
ncbi:MAG: hypothetical protein RLZZ232_2744, partial [Planctomycetota bacterium]